MRHFLALAAGAAALVLPLGWAAQPSVASAATPGPATCSGGTPTAPASVPTGTYSTLTISGVCAVNAGPVTVTGNVTVGAGNALLAAYAANSSGLTVDGNINVGSAAALVLGCEAFEFPCFDDPNPSAPTLNGSETVQGSIEASGALGVIVHNSTIGTDIVETGTNGGTSCAPATTGVFSAFNSPVYSDYEDSTIGGNLRVTGMTSCWFGAIRNKVGGSLTYANNHLTSTDASENLDNTIAGNLLCTNNVPAVQYGDSGSSPNVVSGFGTGECAFGVTSPSNGTPMAIATPSTTKPGYWLVAADGGIFSFNVPFFGSQSGTALSQPIAGMAAVAGGGSYNLAEGTGTVFGNGPRASDCSGLTGTTLNKPVVGMAAAPGGNGCWLVASDGGVFSFGSNAPFFGSAGALPLVKPVVGIAATPNNDGYDIVASDGGVFTYGPGAAFYGSMGGKPLNQPVVGIAVDPATGGYWMVAKDGGVFSFNAPFFGSMGGKPLNQPIVGMAATPSGKGYYLVAADGGIFSFGDATFQGSTGALHLVKPVVGMSLG